MTSGLPSGSSQGALQKVAVGMGPGVRFVPMWVREAALMQGDRAKFLPGDRAGQTQRDE